MNTDPPKRDSLYKHPGRTNNQPHRIDPALETVMDAPVKALNTEKAKALQAALAQIEK